MYDVCCLGIQEKYVSTVVNADMYRVKSAYPLYFISFSEVLASRGTVTNSVLSHLP